jgi:hypothetical protein
MEIEGVDRTAMTRVCGDRDPRFPSGRGGCSVRPQQARDFPDSFAVGLHVKLNSWHALRTASALKESGKYVASSGARPCEPRGVPWRGYGDGGAFGALYSRNGRGIPGVPYFRDPRPSAHWLADLDRAPSPQRQSGSRSACLPDSGVAFASARRALRNLMRLAAAALFTTERKYS